MSPPVIRRFALVRRPPQPIRIAINPFLAGILLLIAVALLGWSAATTSYALFRDEFLQQIAARHAAADRASAAEIARLKSDLARVASRALVEREAFSKKIEILARRQATVERRQEALSNLSLSVEPAAPADELRLGPDRAPQESHLDTRDGNLDLASLARTYDTIDRRQTEAITGLRGQIERERAALTGVYAALGLAHLSQAPVKAGLGGVYIPFGLGGRPDPLNAELARLETEKAQAERLRAGLDELPLRSPAPGAPEMSGFGSRADPFLGTPAFHSGLDLGAPAGTPARATASGVVLSAGWHGGYGRMVEIRHAHGFSTRYAHLSSIAVREGQEVKVGDVVGLVGSTGRSTGPHLHYETRVNDQALDPRRLLAAGAALD